MSSPNFGYQYEKLAQARSSLMAPHLSGEDQSFASAFHACSLGFHDFDVEETGDEDARGWVETIKRLMDTTNVQDTTGEGTYLHRARQMTLDEKWEFSKAVDELASFFGRTFWAGH